VPPKAFRQHKIDVFVQEKDCAVACFLEQWEKEHVV
jgi:hypothetical protein